MVTDQDGRVSSRRDYTAFGEESVTPERAAGLGYAGQSETRKGYTGYEKDTESGLDFAQARYYNSTHGRYTSVDPLTASATIRNPQTFNRYTYVLNSPYKFTDPLGLIPETTGACGNRCRNSDGGAFGFIGLYSDNGSTIVIADEQQAEPPTPPPPPAAEQNQDKVTPPATVTEYAGMQTLEVFYNGESIGTMNLTPQETAARVALAEQAYNEGFQAGLRQAQEEMGDNVSVVSGNRGSGSDDNRSKVDAPSTLDLSSKPGVTVPLGPTTGRGSSDSNTTSVDVRVRDNLAAQVVATETIATSSQNIINREGNRIRTITLNGNCGQYRTKVNTENGVMTIVNYAAKIGVNQGYVRYMQSRRALSQ